MYFCPYLNFQNFYNKLLHFKLLNEGVEIIQCAHESNNLPLPDGHKTRYFFPSLNCGLSDNVPFDSHQLSILPSINLWPLLNPHSGPANSPNCSSFHPFHQINLSHLSIWITSHIDIPGNGTVDEAAQQITLLPETTPFTFQSHTTLQTSFVQPSLVSGTRSDSIKSPLQQTCCLQTR